MNHKDYSYINNLDDLKKEINAARFRVQQSKQQLKERWHRLPAEAIKKTVGSVIPLFLSKNIAYNSWQFIKSGIGVLVSKRDAADKKNEMKAAVKKIGLLAAAQGLLSRIIKK